MGDDYQEIQDSEKHAKESKNAVLHRLEMLLEADTKAAGTGFAGLGLGLGLASGSLRPSETTLRILVFVYGSLGSNSYLLTSLACRYTYILP